MDTTKIIPIKCKGHTSVALDQLIPIQGNLKDLSVENYIKLRKEILELGFSEPVSVWENDGKFKLLNGTQRFRTLSKMVKEEGFECPEIPVSVVEAKDLREAKKKILALTSQFGEMTKDGLYEFMSESDLSFDEIEKSFRFPEIDFKDFEDEFYEKEDTTEEDDNIPEPPKEAKSKLGDLYLLGNHRLLCGDSTDIKSVELLLCDEKVDLVLTDPPYNCASHSKNYASDVSVAMKKLKESDWDNNFDINPSLNSIRFSCKENCTVYIFTSHFLIQKIWDHLDSWCDFTNYCVWSKPNPMPSLSKRHWTFNSELCVYGTIGSKRIVNFPAGTNAYSVWDVAKKSDGTHPTQKPIELLMLPILFNSLESSSVLDLFGGSGSTLIACEKTNRKCFMMELDPIYVDVIVSRYVKYTGNNKIIKNGEEIEWEL